MHMEIALEMDLFWKLILGEFLFHFFKAAMIY